MVGKQKLEIGVGETKKRGIPWLIDMRRHDILQDDI